jgi:predicted RNase H-like HicB family nuclease
MKKPISFKHILKKMMGYFMLRKKLYITLTVLFEKEPDGRWVALCKQLGTSTYGDSIEDAKERIEEAISLQLNTLESVGERERFFKENEILILEMPKTKEISVNMPINSNIFSQTYAQPVNVEMLWGEDYQQYRGIS